MLCETCKSIFLELVSRYGYAWQDMHCDDKHHHHTVEELYEAAAAHCQICVQLFLNLQQHYWGTLLAREKEMISEMMVRQKGENMPSDTYLLTCDASIRPMTLEDEVIRLHFITRDHHFNTSRNTTGRLPITLNQHFISVRSKYKYAICFGGISGAEL
jgi:hypothetical protein